MLKLSGFKKFLEKLRTPRERDDFNKHLRKYINLWLPDCPFEVTTTNRYTITTQEAAVVARRSIKKGEIIKYLCGTLVELTSQEEKDLDLTRRDFSIVTSSRKKKSLLFLGPARFANHDCKANARLTTTGNVSMSVVAVRPIAQNEEITVIYGENYFGEDNCECLCESCERSGIGGWTLLTDLKEPTPPPIEESGPYSFRMKRKYQATSSPIPSDDGRRYSPSSERSSLTPVPRRSKQRVSSALARFSETNDDGVLELTPSESTKRKPDDSSEDRKNPSHWEELPLKKIRLDVAEVEIKTTHLSSKESPELESIFDEDPKLADTPASSLAETTEKEIASIETDNKEEVIEITVESDLSTLETDEDFDDLNLCIVRKRKRGRPRKSEQKVVVPVIEMPQTRHPRDYINTPILLAEPYSRWVQCKTCSGVWVQQNGYYTRRECPRCERHSKLYGYQWPKAEQCEMERVMDHRTVHRFLSAGEEEALRKAKRRSSTPQATESRQ
jgi:[histone H4]-N-methyl-L-lysine20 N-methyltransferase